MIILFKGISMKLSFKVNLSLKVNLLLASSLFFTFLSVNVFAVAETDVKLSFDASTFKFTYVPNVAPSLLVIENKKQHDLKALTESFWQLPTAKSYFELSYAYIKNYGRKYKESIIVDIDGSGATIFSSAPLRKISIANNSIPLYLLVSENKKINAKTDSEQFGFQFNLPKKFLNNFCNTLKPCQINITDVVGEKYSYSYKYKIEPTKLPIKGVGFYGMPCEPSCVAFNSQTLKMLSEQVNIKVIDVANQQRTFNETILCDSGVLKGCQNGLVSNTTKGTLEWHVMENQLVVHQQEITQHKRFYQSEVLIAWINPMMNETQNVATVYAKHKNKKSLVELLAKKTAVTLKVIMAKSNQK
jgi:hypothetical protein